ncbi:hypothetical protein SAMN04490357_7682 [Streptomyces misionensis]|uniref:Uncharacterized protein n=1 Tax=Streptomyces misionensis TaxID=67331 RepID=A0A1H5K2T9_9ACTN|nr:hypothetical protein [Streptomyces misionensis]SEE59136.1 hypothetical protein SAMN04490357_7682 [Streptomyces misionensis]
MNAALIFHNGVSHDWTAADYDSYVVLAELGTPHPAARVNLARRGRPLRRAIRAALRTTARIHLSRTPIRKEAVGR